MSLPKDERILASFRSQLEYHRKRIAKLREIAEMPAPWEKYPTYSRGCIGWRMGSGEDFLQDWRDWYGSLSAEQRAGYRERHGEPSEWSGFYESYTIPPQGLEPYWASVLKRYEDQVKWYEEYLRTD